MAIGIQTNLIDATALVLLHHAITTRRGDAEIFAHPYVRQLVEACEAYGDLLAQANATALKYGVLDLTAAVATATAEGALPAATTITPATVNATPARQAALYEPTDDEARRLPQLSILGEISNLVDSAPATLTPAQLQLVALCVTMGLSALQNWIIAALKASCASMTNTMGTTGIAMTYNAYRAGIAARRDAGARGRGLALMVRSNGWGQIETDILALGGAVQFSALGGRLVDRNSDDSLYPNVYGATDVMVTTGLPTAAADTEGGLFLPGCQTLHLSAPKPVGQRKVLLQTPMFSLFELGYAGGSTAQYEVVFWASLDFVQQVAACKILHVT